MPSYTELLAWRERGISFMPGPRPAGVEGSVRQLPSGRWQARFPYSLDPHKRPVPGGPFRTEIQARAALENACMDVRIGTLVLAQDAPTSPVEAPRTVSDALQALTTEHTYLAPHTVSGYRSIAATVINECPQIPEAEWLGNVPIETLTSARLHAWRTLLAANGVTPHKQRLAWRVLSSALSWEVEMGRIPSNPCVGVRNRRTSRATAETNTDTVRLPTWQEFHQLVSAVQGHDNKVLVCVLGWCGMRFSEAAAIEPRSLLTATHEIRLSHQWVKPIGEPWRTTPLKSGEQRRIPVPAGLWDYVEEIARQHLPAPSGRANTLWYPPTTDDGIGVWTPSAFREAVWLPARETTGLDIRVKDLRAYAVSTLVDAGATEFEAQRLLGHANAAVTRKHYVRAQDARAHDPARSSLRIRRNLSTQGRMDALWNAWVRRYGNPLR